MSGDFESFLGFYTDDAVVMPPNHPALENKEAILSWMKSFPKVIGAQFTCDEIGGAGDFAYVRGKYFFTLQPEGIPTSIEDHGKYIEIRKRQPDGSWPVSRDIFNSDLAP